MGMAGLRPQGPGPCGRRPAHPRPGPRSRPGWPARTRRPAV